MRLDWLAASAAQHQWGWRLWQVHVTDYTHVYFLMHFRSLKPVSWLKGYVAYLYNLNLWTSEDLGYCKLLLKQITIAVLFLFLYLQTLYTFPENFRAYKALIAAQYSGAKIKVASAAPDFVFGETNKSDAFLKKFPLGKVGLLCFLL